MDTQLLEPLIQSIQQRRRALLPIWMKIFVWLFLLTGIAAIIAMLIDLTGAKFEVSLYGLTSYDPLSGLALLINLLFILKGIVAYGLWFEKVWAISLGIVDAVLGIVICLLLMAYDTQRHGTTIRLELIPLIFYLTKHIKIRPYWNGKKIQRMEA